MSVPYLISNPNALARAGQAIGEFFVTTIPNAAKEALNATAAFFSKATIGNMPVWAWFVVGLGGAGVITIALLIIANHKLIGEKLSAVGNKIKNLLGINKEDNKIHDTTTPLPTDNTDNDPDTTPLPTDNYDV